MIAPIVDLKTRSAALTLMVLMTLCDGEVAEPEVDRMQWAFSALLGAALIRAEVREAVNDARSRGLELEAFLAEVEPDLVPGARRLLLLTAYFIAAADGRVLDEEDDFLRRVARGLQIPPSEYRLLLTPMSIARVVEEH